MTAKKVTDEAERALLKALDDGPRLTLLALADRAEELGDQELAAGYRWLARHDKRPRYAGLFSAWPARWMWDYSHDPADYRRKGGYVLPDYTCRASAHSGESAAYKAAARDVGAWLETSKARPRARRPRPAPAPAAPLPEPESPRRPWSRPEPCRHPQHEPPGHMVITGPYRHTCPGCRRSVVIYPPSLRWAVGLGGKEKKLWRTCR